ncbi:DUF6717 family protein [Chitinophaga sancti]|uniref:DUF6717 family protein n=1 Tax=Chitinophaga sancti TaxID=1004 RepID=UPI002A756B28|nr:DUF6717 family protein [Chitinophaga sancti]WPQ60597.1 DUF6717 family protein [Chitinophaga sancti]
MKKTFRFYKTEKGSWYIDLPEWTDGIEALQMVEGADTMLDTVSNQSDEVYLELSDEPFEGADVLHLTENLQDSITGGIYMMPFYKGTEINHPMWLCGVTAFVFKGLPPLIYVGYPV